MLNKELWKKKNIYIYILEWLITELHKKRNIALCVSTGNCFIRIRICNIYLNMQETEVNSFINYFTQQLTLIWFVLNWWMIRVGNLFLLFDFRFGVGSVLTLIGFFEWTFGWRWWGLLDNGRDLLMTASVYCCWSLWLVLFVYCVWNTRITRHRIDSFSNVTTVSILLMYCMWTKPARTCSYDMVQRTNDK